MRPLDLRGHWFSDCFTDLIDAVADVFEGRRTAGVRFARETGGGGFVDLARRRRSVEGRGEQRGAVTPTFEITGEDPRPWPKREPGAFGPSADRPESG